MIHLGREHPLSHLGGLQVAILDRDGQTHGHTPTAYDRESLDRERERQTEREAERVRPRPTERETDTRHFFLDSNLILLGN